MSVNDQAVAAVISQIALAADGAVIGIALAYIAVRSVLKYSSTSSALRKIRNAPSVSVGDIRSILSSSDQDNSSGEERKLVVVRGIVEAKSAVSRNPIWQNILVSHESKEKAVILQRTQTCLYNEWKGFFGWNMDIRSIFRKSLRRLDPSPPKKVPFILMDADGGRGPKSDYLVVNLNGSKHPLPLTTVYYNLQPISPSPYTFLQALFGHEYPVGLLDEEKILPVGKELTAVGLVSLKDGIPEVISCKDLPFFLSNLSKTEMVEDLNFKTKVLMWGGVVIGSLAIAILGYAVSRNWNLVKRCCRMQLRRDPWANEGNAEVAAEEEVGDIPDGQLCVICLTRQRRSAFIPCGHLVCCPRCSISVAQELSPKCPVCRQSIRYSLRIYDS